MTSDETQPSTSTLWKKCQAVAKSAGTEVIQKVLWLYFAAESPGTPRWAKTTIYGALAYFILPLDALPDFLPGVGYVDDLGVLATAVAAVLVHINEDVKQAARKKMEEWGMTAPSPGHTSPPVG
jgi:uncharacterized membrane protein YkvA (DUF1232 family)